jgi:hypothetical protein
MGAISATMIIAQAPMSAAMTIPPKPIHAAVIIAGDSVILFSVCFNILILDIYIK